MRKHRGLNHIRRCKTCGFKTHRRLWENGRCPICGSAIGFTPSIHEGLNKREIELIKRYVKKISQRYLVQR